MLHSLNKFLEKIIPFITPTSVMLGILFSTYIQDYSFLVPWLFAFMTFEGSLTMKFQAIKGAFLHPFPAFIILIILHIIMPIWALIVGHLTFPTDQQTITGLVLAMLLPTGITSFIWVAMKNGNRALTLAVILIDSLLSPVIVPFSLTLFVGQTVALDVVRMMNGLFFMIVLPSLLGVLLNEITKGQAGKKLKTKLAPISKLFLALVVMLNGSVVAPYFKEDFNMKLIAIIFIVFLIAFSGYYLSYRISKILKFDNETIISATFSGGMRNISAGAVIAVAYFPAAVGLPVIVGMLFQQIIASFYSSFLEKRLITTAQKEKKLQHSNIL